MGILSDNSVGSGAIINAFIILNWYFSKSDLNSNFIGAS